MSTVIAGQTYVAQSRWELSPGGALVDLDATPTIAITNVATGAVALAATTTGVTHPATGTYGYAYAVPAALPGGTYLVAWAGLYLADAVTATETLTVLAAATAEAANTDPDGIWYCTEEMVSSALDLAATVRNRADIARAIEAGARAVEAPECANRRFYPVDATRYFDWPSRALSRSERLWLDGDELISVSTVVSGGTTIADTDYFLEPRNAGPPYDSIEIDLASSAAWSSGQQTWQRSIGITGTYGFRQRWTSVGTVAEALDDSETAVNVDGPAAVGLGVGSIMRVDSERMIVTARSVLTTGQTVITTALTAADNDVVVLVTSGAAFAIGETLLIDAERMLVEDIAGNSLIVRRALGATPLAAHATGTTIYGYRTLTVQRAALGTVTAAHADASAVVRFEPPGLVVALNVAEAMNTLLNESSGYARTAGTGESAREYWGRSLGALRKQVRSAHGRHNPYRGAV